MVTKSHSLSTTKPIDARSSMIGRAADRYRATIPRLPCRAQPAETAVRVGFEPAPERDQRPSSGLPHADASKIECSRCCTDVPTWSQEDTVATNSRPRMRRTPSSRVCARNEAEQIVCRGHPHFREGAVHSAAEPPTTDRHLHADRDQAVFDRGRRTTSCRTQEAR